MTPAASCPPDARPLPEHGTTARANGRPAAGRPPCPCPPCRKAVSRYSKELAYDNHNGRPRSHSASETAAHIQQLINLGMTIGDIARAAGCNPNSIHHARKPGVRITSRVANGIAGVRASISPTAVLPAFGAVRRIQAAAALGHTERAFAEETGLLPSYINELARGRRQTVTAMTHDRIDAAYRRLVAKPAPEGRGPSKARTRARVAGWPTPEQWDGEIDNAAADPLAWARGEDDRRRIEDIVADAEELHADHGLSWEAAAAQVGVLVNTLHTYRSRVRERTAASAAS